MLHPFTGRPRLRDILRAHRYPEHATSDEIARVAAQHVERIHGEDDGVARDLATIAVVIVGLGALSWALGL